MQALTHNPDPQPLVKPKEKKKTQTIETLNAPSSSSTSAPAASSSKTDDDEEESSESEEEEGEEEDEGGEEEEEGRGVHVCPPFIPCARAEETD